MQLRMGRVEWALLLALSMLWGGSFFFAELALAAFGPVTVVLGRVGIAALVLLAWVHATGRRMPRSPAAWGAFFVMGAINNVIPFGLIFWGQTHIDSGLAAILNATTPLFTVLLAHWLTRDERLGAARLAGVLAGLAGVALMIGPQAVAGYGVAALAEIAVLGAALSYGLAGIYGRRFAALPPAITAAGMLTASAAMALPAALWLEQPWTAEPTLTAAMSLLGLALLSTALAYLLYFRILAAAGATNLLLVTFLIPVSALLLGTFVLGERIGTDSLAGLALILAGLITIDGRLFARLRLRWRDGTGRGTADPA